MSGCHVNAKNCCLCVCARGQYCRQFGLHRHLFCLAHLNRIVGDLVVQKYRHVASTVPRQRRLSMYVCAYVMTAQP